MAKIWKYFSLILVTYFVSVLIYYAGYEDVFNVKGFSKDLYRMR